MKDEIGGISIEGSVRLKPEMYSILVSHFRDYELAKNLIENVVSKISHNEYKENVEDIQ